MQNAFVTIQCSYYIVNQRQRWRLYHGRRMRGGMARPKNLKKKKKKGERKKEEKSEVRGEKLVRE